MSVLIHNENSMKVDVELTPSNCVEGIKDGIFVRKVDKYGNVFFEAKFKFKNDNFEIIRDC